jgi:hypothetical protein
MMIAKVRILWIGLIVAVVVLGWFELERVLRSAALVAGVSETSLHRWWITLLLLRLTGFFITAALLYSFLRSMPRVVANHIIASAISNSFVVWLLSALSAIAADPLAASGLSSVGLNIPSPWFLGLTLLWIVLSLWILFRSVDDALKLGAQRSSV